MAIEDIQSFFATNKRYERLVPSQYTLPAGETDPMAADAALGWLSFPTTRVILDFSEKDGVGGNDVLAAGSLNDVMGGGAGNDLLLGYDGDDRLDGGTGNDVLWGGRGTDVLRGEAGDDSLSGDSYISRVADGQLGLPLTADRLFSNSDGELTPTLLSSAAEYMPKDTGYADYLDGGTGNDTLFGGRGADTLIGGDGNDMLDPGSRGFRDNRDVLTGGFGRDVFYLNSSEDESPNPEIRAFFKGLLSDNAGTGLGSGIYDAINKALENIFKTNLGKVLTGVLGSVVGGIAGAALSEIINLVTKVIEESLPTSEDTVIVTDFDPREDVLVLPFGTLSNQDIRISVVDSENRIDELGNGTGSSEKAIRVVKEFDDNSIREIALVFLSESFLADMNIFERNGDDVRAILQNVINSAVGFSRNGVQRQDIADQGLGDGANATSDKVIKMLGAVGPMLWAATNITEERLVVGTFQPDVLDANRNFIQPGTELNNVNLGSVGFEMHGFDGADRLVGNAGADKLYGGGGDDSLYAFGSSSGAPDVLEGGSGEDTIYSSQLVDNLQAFGGAGVDTVSFEFETEDAPDLSRAPQTGVHLVAYSGVQGDGLASPGIEGNTPGQDRFFLNGIEVVVGSRFGDNFSMTAADETVKGGAGNDLVDGQGGNDSLNGGDGNDTLMGGAGKDTLHGGAGNDVMMDSLGGGDFFGDTGNDQVEIGALAPNTAYRVYGGAGNDRLVLANTSAASVSFESVSAYQSLFMFFNNGSSINVAMRTNYSPDGDDTNDGALQFTETLQFSDGVFSLAQSFLGAESHAFTELMAGSTGNDVLNGRGGNDRIHAGFGNDTVLGGQGQDLLYADFGIDRVLGNEGHDTLYGGEGGDVLIGGTGDDALYGDEGNDTLYGENEVDGTTTGRNTLSGGNGNDTLRGGNGLDQLDGGSGSDSLVGLGGTDSLTGGDGNDTFYGGAGDDTLNGDADNDRLYGDQGQDLLYGGAGNDWIEGGEGNDTLHGGAGNDTLVGGADYDDVLYGDDGDDTLWGIAPQDAALPPGRYTLIGGAGNDRLFGGDWTDQLDGGTGNDRLSGAGSVDALTGGDGNDTLDGGAGDDTLSGGADADVLDGGEGLDTADFSEKTAAIQVTLNGATASTVSVQRPVAFLGSIFLAEDRLVNVENVVGGSGNDQLVGDALANYLTGSQGNDVLIGNAGDDTLDGGAGVDRVSYTEKTAGLNITLNANALTVVFVGGVAEDKIFNVENVTGGSGNDVLQGDALANSLAGWSGNDDLRGNAGNDTLDGGEGIDRASYTEKTDAVRVALDGSMPVSVFVNGVVEDQIVSIENLLGGSGNDDFTGDALANHLEGGWGNDKLTGGAGLDTLSGGEGSDTANYAGAVGALTVTLNGALTTGARIAGVLEDHLQSIENIVGGSGADTLIGDAQNNTFRGGAGNDALNGGAGSDTADYSDKAAPVVVALNGSTAVTVLVGGVAEDRIVNIENLLGGSGNDAFTGDALANRLEGGSGNDTLTGGAGLDTLSGGLGSDTANYAGAVGALTVTLNGALTTGARIAGVLEDHLQSIENIVGGSVADTLIGDAQNNTFRGGAGSDALNGGAGSDTADYSDKAAAVVAALNGSTAVTVFVGGVAEDRIVNIENLTGGAAGDTLSGDSLANQLDGGAGNDTLTGGLGNDHFVFSTAVGAGNVDTIADFQAGVDKIVLDDDIFTALGIVGTVPGVALTASRFQLGAAANDAADRIVYNQATGQLFYDTDGNGAAAQQQIALIGVSTHAALTAGDFLVVA